MFSLIVVWKDCINRGLEMQLRKNLYDEVFYKRCLKILANHQRCLADQENKAYDDQHICYNSFYLSIGPFKHSLLVV